MLIWRLPRVVAALQPWAEISQRLRRIALAPNRIVDLLEFDQNACCIMEKAMSSSVVVNEGELESLYADFVDEDHDLAEEGIEDYGRSLTTEDIT